MQFVKAFGLAVLAALASAAFLGAGTASAQHQIVLCKDLVTLCPSGKLWSKGTLLTALATESSLLSSLGTITCPDSIVRGLAEQEVSNSKSYNIDGVTVEFGELPTPTLGLGCTGPCGATNQDWIHASFENLRLLVESVDKYFILGAGLALILNCFFGITCVYRANHVKVPITHIGTHPSHAGSNLPLANFLVELERQTTHSASTFCPATSIWHALYTFTLAEDHLGNTGLAWPSLAVLDEIVLCKKLVSSSELCPTAEFYPAGTSLVALAANSEFKASPFGAIKCEDAVVEAETSTSMGDALGLKFTKIAFGVLPTPELGKGCTTCTEGIHPPPAVSGSITRSGSDYVLKSSEAFELLSCFGLGVTCLYGAENFTALVDPDVGSHKQGPEGKGLAEILVSTPMYFIKGNNFCPEEGTWTANYVVYVLKSEGKEAQGWLALYERL